MRGEDAGAGRDGKGRVEARTESVLGSADVEGIAEAVAEEVQGE